MGERMCAALQKVYCLIWRCLPKALLIRIQCKQLSVCSACSPKGPDIPCCQGTRSQKHRTGMVLQQDFLVLQQYMVYDPTRPPRTEVLAALSFSMSHIFTIQEWKSIQVCIRQGVAQNLFVVPEIESVLTVTGTGWTSDTLPKEGTQRLQVSFTWE